MERRSLRMKSIVAALSFVAASPLGAWGDLIELTNGGKLRGELEQPDERTGTETTTIRTLGGALISIRDEQVRSIARRPRIVEEYEVRAEDAPDEVDAQWALAEWCRKNGLRDQRETHLRRLVDLDPQHERAHRGLGHVRFEGEWTTRDAVMQSRGYVKHGSRYVTPQERDLLEAKEAAEKVEDSWHRKIKKWHSWLTGRSEDLKRDALAELDQVRDPAAVSSLVRVFSEDENAGLRSLYVDLLARIPGDEAVRALVSQSLFDPDPGPRRRALEGIGPQSYVTAAPHYLDALKHEQNVVVCRAAAALEVIGDPQAVPALIGALVTTHTYRLRVPDRSNTYSFGTSGSFANPHQLSLPPEIELQLRTGQLPNGVIVIPPRELAPRRTRLVTVTQDHQNAQALAALTALTGESFGFDKRAWGMWWATRQQAPPAAKPNP